MNPESRLAEIRSKTEQARRLAQEIFDLSEAFPAVNRNAKRVLASVEMIRLNVEGETDVW
jgi:hypothetical protein